MISSRLATRGNAEEPEAGEEERKPAKDAPEVPGEPVEDEAPVDEAPGGEEGSEHDGVSDHISTT